MKILSLNSLVPVFLVFGGLNSTYIDKYSVKSSEPLEDETDAYKNIIKNFQKTKFGEWGNWDECPKGEFATGFRLKTQQSLGDTADDTGVNAIKLYCNKLGERSHESQVLSLEGRYGEWGAINQCKKGVLLGFQVRNADFQGESEFDFILFSNDDTAINNFRFFCSGPNPKTKEQELEGDGTTHGDWDRKEMCPKGKAICAIRAQVEDTEESKIPIPVGIKTHRYDKTGLNNVEFKCCDIVSHERTCLPGEKWGVIMNCTHIGPSDTPAALCSYRVKKGITKTKFTSMTVSDQITHMVKNNIDGGVDILELKAKYNANYEMNTLTIEEWTDLGMTTDVEENEYTAEFPVRPNTRTELVQLIGSCGPYSLYANRLKFVTYSVDSNGKGTNPKEEPAFVVFDKNHTRINLI